MAKTVKFAREFMRNVLWGDVEGTRVIEDTITGTGRWSIYHRIIFEYEGTFYSTSYSEGATEQQDESPWEYQREVECIVVRPVTKPVVVYEAIEDGE